MTNYSYSFKFKGTDHVTNDVDIDFPTVFRNYCHNKNIDFTEAEIPEDWKRETNGTKGVKVEFE